jgi:hypothetical protein
MKHKIYATLTMRLCNCRLNTELFYFKLNLSASTQVIFEAGHNLKKQCKIWEAMIMQTIMNYEFAMICQIQVTRTLSGKGYSLFDIIKAMYNNKAI